MNSHWALAVMVAMGASALAERRAGSVDEVLARYASALGDTESVKTLVITAEYLGPMWGPRPRFTFYWKAPDKALQITKWGFGRFRQGFNGRSGWHQDPTGAVRRLSPSALAELLRLANPLRFVRLRQLYSDLSLQSAEECATSGTADCKSYVIKARRRDQGSDHFYFDPKSALLVRMDEWTPSLKDWTHVYFEDYRVVGAVTLPFSQRSEYRQSKTTVRILQVQLNLALADALFHPRISVQ